MADLLVASWILLLQVGFFAEPIVDETEKAARAILGEGGTGVSFSNRGVRMRQHGRRDEYEGARREFNHQTKLPEDKVATFGGVKTPKGLDGAPAKGAIQNVAVLLRPNVRPKVEGGSRENASVEDSSELWHFFEEDFEVPQVVVVHKRVPQCEAA